MGGSSRRRGAMLSAVVLIIMCGFGWGHIMPGSEKEGSPRSLPRSVVLFSRVWMRSVALT
eukprot:1716395-Rhodomonas_salina.1